MYYGKMIFTHMMNRHARTWESGAFDLGSRYHARPLPLGGRHRELWLDRRGGPCPTACPPGRSHQPLLTSPRARRYAYAEFRMRPINALRRTRNTGRACTWTQRVGGGWGGPRQPFGAFMNRPWSSFLAERCSNKCDGISISSRRGQ